MSTIPILAAKRKHMKKSLLVAALSIVMIGAANRASAQAFDEGTKHLNVGIGLGSTYYGYTYLSGSDYSSIPTIFLSYDQGTGIELGTGIIGLGGFVGFSSAKANYAYPGYEWNYSWTNIVVGARGNYHFPIDNEKFDAYAGVSLGLWMQTYEYTNSDPFWGGTLDSKDTYTNLYYSGCLGGKYMFSESFGAFAELGWDVALLKVGVTLGL